MAARRLTPVIRLPCGRARSDLPKIDSAVAVIATAGALDAGILTYLIDSEKAEPTRLREGDGRLK